MFNRIAKLLSFTRVVKNEANVTDVKFDQGGGDNITAEHFSDPGDDSFPLPGDYVLGADVARSGSKVAAGYVDPVNTPKASEGEKRIYARNPADGSVICELWLKNDGSIHGINGSGYFTLESGGDFVANGAKMLTDGDVITSDNISLRNHTHIGNLGSPTGPPLP